MVLVRSKGHGRLGGKQKSRFFSGFFVSGAEGGTRTRTSETRHPLKMVCLPDSTTSAFTKISPNSSFPKRGIPFFFLDPILPEVKRA